MEGKGYYSTFTLSYNDNEGALFDPVIHGGSYSIPTKNVDFLTWKKNIETGKYWLKLHTISGKEIRLQVSFDELNQLMRACGNDECEFGEQI